MADTGKFGNGKSGNGKSGKGNPNRDSSNRENSSRDNSSRDNSDRGNSDRDRGRRGSSGTRSNDPRRQGAKKWTRPERTDRPRRSPEEQEAYDGPPIPEDITGEELHHSVIQQLQVLPEKLGLKVARHLVAAGSLIDEDPETAHKHALAAKVRAPRLAVVREAVGETAYAAGKYGLALSELRAAKRINGATDYLPTMADCHRALGHPEEALKLAKSPAVAGFSTESKAEMLLVEAGARRDMGQLDAALTVLERAPLQTKTRGAWIVRLRYAYADTLEAAGKLSEALAWFHRTHAIDNDELTDSEERAAALESQIERPGD